ncbi:MAG: nitroreductase [Bacteroidia bacterium]
MELLTTIKEKILLEASLEALHEESLAWISSINLWEDESTFYKDILDNKMFQHTEKKDREKINGLLETAINNKLNSFKREIIVHEKNLGTLLSTGTNAGNYRDTHKKLFVEFTELEQKMNQAKTAIFELLKLVNMNFFDGNETLNIIHERRAVRKYKKDPVDKIHIEQIIAAGRMAPSAMNKQPWKFYVLTNKEKLQLYSDKIKKIAGQIFHLSMTEHDKEPDPIFHGAPVAIFITAPRNNDWASIDIGMCVQNIMLAARSMGYDTCPVGLAKFIEQTDVYNELQIPKEEEIKLAVVLGYGDEKPVLHKRLNNNLVFLS